MCWRNWIKLKKNCKTGKAGQNRNKFYKPQRKQQQKKKQIKRKICRPCLQRRVCFHHPTTGKLLSEIPFAMIYMSEILFAMIYMSEIPFAMIYMSEILFTKIYMSEILFAMIIAWLPCVSFRYDTIFSFKNNARDKSKYKWVISNSTPKIYTW